MATAETHYTLPLPSFDKPVKLLIVVAPYYKDIADNLIAGARVIEREEEARRGRHVGVLVREVDHDPRRVGDAGRGQPLPQILCRQHLQRQPTRCPVGHGEIRIVEVPRARNVARVVLGLQPDVQHDQVRVRQMLSEPGRGDHERIAGISGVNRAPGQRRNESEKTDGSKQSHGSP